MITAKYCEYIYARETKIPISDLEITTVVWKRKLGRLYLIFMVKSIFYPATCTYISMYFFKGYVIEVSRAKLSFPLLTNITIKATILS